MNDNPRYRKLEKDEVPATPTDFEDQPDDGFVLVLPLPPGEPPASHPTLGRPTGSWIYRNAQGQRLFYVMRFDLPDRSKEFRPCTLWRGRQGHQEWRWKGVPPQRPLYNLHRLADRPKAPVLICEGEKSADSAQSIFREFVTVTSPNGSESTGKADWSPLKVRDVLIWPDHDRSGADYACEVGEILLGYDCQVRVIDVAKLVEIDGGARKPDRKVDGWDAADAVEEWNNRLPALQKAALELALPFEPEKEPPRSTPTPTPGKPHPKPETKDAQLVLVHGADVKPTSVRWLWLYGLQYGVFNLLAGQSTTGKTTIALSFAATITSGGQWPDGQAIEPGRVIFWSGEDGIGDTLMPRFLAAGGERENIYFIGGVQEGERKRPFDPAADMPKLAEIVLRLKDVRLIVLDPVAVVVRGDSHKNTETRVGLQPFADLCAQTGACGLGIHHFTKNATGGNPLDRVSGSLAFHALPRCILIAARDQNGGQDARRALMRAKVSNGPDWGGFDYVLDRRALDDWPEIEAQRVLWGNAIEGSARDILAEFEANQTTNKAEAFLAAALKDGPRLAAEVIAEADKVGIPERTLRYNFKQMGGVTERQGQGRSHFGIWEFPKGIAQ
jgi:hypothetical protein